MSAWTLKVRVTPRSSRDEVEGWDGEMLHVRVTARPAEGQANEACRDLLAKTLGVSRGRVRLMHGTRSREKVFEIDGGDPHLLSRVHQL